MEIGKVKIIALFIILVLSATTISVFAIEYFWRTEPEIVESGIILITYPTPNTMFGLYWDIGFTQPVTVIDFGEMVHPDAVTEILKEIWIRNEGDSWIRVYWNSTLSSITTEINEHWRTGSPNGPLLNGTQLEVGAGIRTYYRIEIPAYATVGTYNWTLSVWAEHWY